MVRTTLIYSDDNAYLQSRAESATQGEELLLRDAKRWRGEVEHADDIEVHGDYPHIADAYGVKPANKISINDSITLEDTTDTAAEELLPTKTRKKG